MVQDKKQLDKNKSNNNGKDSKKAHFLYDHREFTLEPT
jgi:hypothetical protein